MEAASRSDAKLGTSKECQHQFTNEIGEDDRFIADFDVNATVDAPRLLMLIILRRHAILHICTISSPSGDLDHQLAFLTPGMFPSRAFILNGYCTDNKCPGPMVLYGVGLTLAILKSLSTPLDFPPSMHLLLICVDLV